MLEELEKLEIEFQMMGYSQKNIESLKTSNNAMTTQEYIENLKVEKSYWNEV